MCVCVCVCVCVRVCLYITRTLRINYVALDYVVLKKGIICLAKRHI